MRVSKAQLDAERKSKQEDTFKWQEYVHSLKEQLKTALQTAEDDASGWKKLIESKEEELAFAGAQFEFKEQRYVDEDQKNKLYIKSLMTLAHKLNARLKLLGGAHHHACDFMYDREELIAHFCTPTRCLLNSGS